MWFIRFTVFCVHEYCFCAYILTLSLRTTPFWRFHGLLSFQPFFGHFLLFLEENTKSIRFCTKFYVKAAIFLQSNCTSLLLCRKPAQRNWRHYLKSFRKQCSFFNIISAKDSLLFMINSISWFKFSSTTFGKKNYNKRFWGLLSQPCFLPLL